ncbi:hypothetical protein HWV62_20514 [Athelia sp. TMB]|nr:hypothetical protein HWV62_20514 [Athelia sp. TMB]
MIEDEIQYLGTKMTPSTLVGRSFAPSTPVTGVVLHVEGHGMQPPSEMRFLRNLTRSVTIGRKSTSDHRSAPGEPSIAGFACQVVSGKHAKLAFSDTGLVYIIDLGSRHGTHIRRPGETVAKTLDPEAPTVLNSGDYITFGKTVGKGSQLVPPVTARVQFLYNPEPEIYEVPSTSPSPFADISHEPSRSRKLSGRYGLYAPSSFSSPEHSSDEDSSSSKYDHDSDIEEITAPEAQHPPFSSAIPALRALTSQFRASPYELAPMRSSATDSVHAHIPSRSHSPMDLSSPTPSPVGAYPLDLEPEYAAGNDREPSENRSSEAGSDSDAENEEREAENEGSEAENEASDAENEEGEVLEVRLEQSPESAEPLFSNVVTPSPLSRAASANLDEDLGRPSLMDAAPVAQSRSPSPPSEFDFQGQVKAKDATPANIGDIIRTSDDISAKINDSIERITVGDVLFSFPYGAEVRLLQRELREAAATNDKWNADNASSLNAALGGLPAPTDVREWAASVLDKASAAIPPESPSVRYEEPVLDASVPISQNKSLPVRDEAAETLAEVKASVAAMTSLVSELKAFHENMEKQMTDKLASIESARAELIAATIEAEASNQLKRKHSEMESVDPAAMDVCESAPVSAVEARPIKRLRRIASTVMHTTTVAAVGAVATWAALAFS